MIGETLMRTEDVASFRHPRTGARLTLNVEEEREGCVIRGTLSADGDHFQIICGIPRFCPPLNYADSFGYEWKRYPTTQLDSKAGWGSQSRRRLFEESGWPMDMRGERILEAGSGMGRFTEVLASTGAEVCTFDYSAAIEANEGNNARFPNISFAQADIYEPPYERGSFDRVLCIGVLQHCPSPRKAFMSLVSFLKPGGRIFVDIYRLHWKSFFLGKYYLRPITRRMRADVLDRFVHSHVGWVYPLTGFLRHFLGRRARSLSWMLSVADYRGVYEVDDRALYQLSLLDTFDALSPAFDRPATLRKVRSWFEEAGLSEVHFGHWENNITAGGRRPR
jgi:2-polyprenyl-3-methyl-5-hydroxy-6-metoxy-1,4-benzoquinol methylase